MRAIVKAALQSFKAAYQNRDSTRRARPNNACRATCRCCQASRPEGVDSCPRQVCSTRPRKAKSVLGSPDFADVLKRQSEAEKLRSTDPKQALEAAGTVAGARSKNRSSRKS